MSTTISEASTQVPAGNMNVASDSVEFNSAELRRCRFAPFLVFLYRVLGCKRRWRVGRIVFNLIFRLEDPMRSATARQIMWQFHGVKIGTYSYGSCFDPGSMLSGITIGRYVSFATGVRIFLQNHPLQKLSTHPLFYHGSNDGSQAADLPLGSLDIGNDVWIGCNALILPGCRRIGNGAVIGAGAVVTKDVPDFSVVVGNPAKRIRDRFPAEIVERIQASKWWLMPIEEVQLKMHEFEKMFDLNG